VHERNPLTRLHKRASLYGAQAMRVGVDARALLAGRGVERYTRGMLAALADGFPDDEWVAFVPGRAPVAEVAGVRLMRHRFGGRALFGAAAVARRPTLAALVGGADVIWLPAPAPVAPGARYVLSVHDRSWELRPSDFTPYERAWHRLARPRRLAREAAAVTAVSHAVARDLADAWGVRAEVVSPGVTALDGARAAVPPAAAPLAAPAPEPRRGSYLLFVGPREPRKAPEVLDAAYSRAREQGLDAELVVVGNGAVRVDDRELASLYAGALAVVQPSFLEGFGLPPLEAAAHGTPAVVSALDCFAETLGDAALRVPPGDVHALADAMLRIAGDHALRARVGAAARERAAAYTWERSAAALHALLLGAT
jgi:glycosyltransferase involved in cell wall biosynthesis